jgi:hypothetical protein
MGFHVHFAGDPSNAVEALDFEEALANADFAYETDAEGDVVSLRFANEKVSVAKAKKKSKAKTKPAARAPKARASTVAGRARRAPPMRIVIASALVLVGGCTPKEPVEIGASCSSVEKIEACAKGKLALCIGGKWQETMVCPGPQGCYRKRGGHGSTTALCDEAVAHAGSVCAGARQQLCSEDGRSQLVCEGGRWRVQAECAGGCSWDSNGVACR